VAHARGLTALLALLLAACGETPSGEAMRAAFAEAPEQVAPVPIEGPRLVLLAPRRATLIPVGGSGPRQLWRGPLGVAIATDGARVVATAGLGQMLTATRVDGPDPIEDLRAVVAAPAATRRTVDLSGSNRDPASMRFGLAFDCTVRAAVQGEWIVAEERCSGGFQSFTNRFWAPAATGQVVRSEQWVGDAVAPVVVLHYGG
jgi:hypothetical protein